MAIEHRKRGIIMSTGANGKADKGKTEEEMQAEREISFFRAMMDAQGAMKAIDAAYKAYNNLRDMDGYFAHQHKVLYTIERKFRKGEVIRDTMFMDDTPAEVLDYCFANFNYLGLQFEKAPDKRPEFYSPLQVLPAINRFVEIVKKSEGRKIVHEDGRGVVEEGEIAGEALFEIWDIERRLYVPIHVSAEVREARNAEGKSGPGLFVNPEFFVGNQNYHAEKDKKYAWGSIWLEPACRHGDNVHTLEIE